MMVEEQRKEKIVLDNIIADKQMTKSRGFTVSWSKVKGVNYIVGKCFRSLMLH